MTEFLSLYTKDTVSQLIGIEDSVDRLNFFYTVICLIGCNIISTTGSYFYFQAITCYTSTYPDGYNFKSYVNNYCWITGTVPLRNNESISHVSKNWEKLADERRINYYQWVPFMLGLQCIMFYFPRFIWQCINFNRLGLDINALVVKANQAMHCNKKADQIKCVRHVAESLHRLLFAHRNNKTGILADTKRAINHIFGIFFVSKRFGTWIVFSYFCIKCLYLANCYLQLYLMRRFLGFSSKEETIFTFGYRLTKNLVNNVDPQESLMFPRITYCKLYIRHLGSTKNHFMSMCGLPFNMINEKIFLFLFYWIWIVFIATALSIPLWYMRLMFNRYRSCTIKKYFKIVPPKYKRDETGGIDNNNKFEDSDVDDELLRNNMTIQNLCNFTLVTDVDGKTEVPKMEEINEFLNHFLRLDGIFIIHILRINAGDVVTGAIVRLLWYNWISRYSKVRSLSKDKKCVYTSDSDSDDDFGDFENEKKDNKRSLPVWKKPKHAKSNVQPTAPSVDPDSFPEIYANV